MVTGPGIATVYTSTMLNQAADEARAQADALVDRGLDAMAAADPEAAITALREALAVDPKNAAAAHALLRALEDSGRFGEALERVQKHIVEHPEDVLGYTRLSIPLQKLGRVPEAEAASGRARILGWKLQLRDDI